MLRNINPKALGWLIASLCLSLPLGAAPNGRLDVLILDGQNNHNWRKDTPEIRKILEETDRFRVDVATSPDAGGDMTAFKPDFGRYDVVVSNYNGDDWSPETRAAFVDYVRGGGGLAVVHAADNAFGNWDAYNEMIGIGGWGGRNEASGPYYYWKDGGAVVDDSAGPTAGHGQRHAYEVVNRAENHPITQGLPVRWLHAPDELYHRMRGPARNITLLASAYSAPETGGTGRDEPVMLAVSYGKGRVFHTLMGHDADVAMQCKGFRTTLARGTEWAATGQVTIPPGADFPEVRDPYDVLPELGPLTSATVTGAIRREVLGAAGDPARAAALEARLLAILQRADATEASRLFICRQLEIVGGAAAVPVLDGLLGNKDRSADAARAALTANPATEAEAALIRELGLPLAFRRTAAARALGSRRSAAAVPALSDALESPNATVVEAAVDALGKIGTPEAAAALAGRTDLESVRALCACAFGILESGNRDAGATLFAKILNREGLPVALETAALRGLLAARPADGLRELDVRLDSPDASVSRAAVGILNRMPAGVDPGPLLVKRLEASSDDTRLLLLAVAGESRSAEALPAVLRLAGTGTDDSAVRAAAVDALGMIPATSESIVFLAECATRANPPLRGRAEAALVSAPGAAAETAVLAGLGADDPALRLRYIAAAGARGLTAATAPLLQLAAVPDGDTQTAAFKALRETAGASDYERLIRLAATAEEAARREAIRTVVRVGRDTDDEGARLTPYLGALQASTGPVRDAFIAGLPDLGGAAALAEAARLARADDAATVDAAMRAVAKWSDTEAVDTILALARESREPVHRVLLMRAFGRLLGLASDVTDDVRLAWCRDALDIGLETEAVRLLITTLSAIPNSDSLSLIEKAGENPELAQDAAAAAVNVKLSLAANPVLSASHNDADLGLCLDGNAASRWTTKSPMAPGMWLMADMRMKGRLLAFELNSTGSPTDYPRSLDVYVGDTPDVGGDPVWSGEPTGPEVRIVLPEPAAGRYLKVVNRGTVPDKWWSIHSFSVDFDPGFPDTPTASATLAEVLGNEGLVTAWDMSNVFTKPDVDGSALFGEVLAPERNAQFALWRRLGAEETSGGMVNFITLIGGTNRAVYLRSNVVSDRDVDVELGVGSDDGVKVWINGTQVHANNAGRPWKADEDRAKATLKKGDNLILMKVCQGAGDWAASMRITVP